jgi:hypothetical protein
MEENNQMRSTGALLILILLTGCATQHDTNVMIAQSNTDRFIAFTTGMNSATSEGARIAISMAFAGGMGMQKFYRERDGVDFMQAALPYATLFMPLAYGQRRHSDGGSMAAGRDIYIESSHEHSAYDSAVRDYFATQYSGITSTEPVDNSIMETLPEEEPIATEVL